MGVDRDPLVQQRAILILKTTFITKISKISSVCHFAKFRLVGFKFGRTVPNVRLKVLIKFY